MLKSAVNFQWQCTFSSEVIEPSLFEDWLVEFYFRMHFPVCQQKYFLAIHLSRHLEFSDITGLGESCFWRETHSLNLSLSVSTYNGRNWLEPSNLNCVLPRCSNIVPWFVEKLVIIVSVRLCGMTRLLLFSADCLRFMRPMNITNLQSLCIARFSRMSRASTRYRWRTTVYNWKI